MQEKVKKSKYKLILSIVIAVIIFILCILLYSNLIDFISTYETREIYAQVVISNGFGVAINGTSLIFGMIPQGGTSRKEIMLENNYKEDARFKIYIEGNISDFLIVSENNFILKPNETKTLTFTTHPPNNAGLGTYDGKVIFIVKNSRVK